VINIDGLKSQDSGRKKLMLWLKMLWCFMRKMNKLSR